MAVHAEALELQLVASGSDASRRRFEHLRRLLFIADAVTGIVSGALVGAVAHASPTQTLLLVAAARGRLAGRRLPVRALRPRGPARVVERRQRGAASSSLTCLAVSWPLFGLLVAHERRAPAAGAFFGALACAAVAGIAALAAPAWPRTARRALRQRTLIVGSGVVASRSAERIQDHPELGLALTGYIDDHHEGVPGCLGPSLPGRPGRAERPRRARASVDRVMIAFTRARHEELLHAHPRVPRRRRGGRRRPAPVRVPRGRAHGRPDRRHAAALDRRRRPSPAPRALSKRTLDIVGAARAAARRSPRCWR